jgi:hypothetical protein
MLIDILAPDLARRGIVMHSPFYAAGNDKISAQQLTATYARLCTNWILWFLSSDTDARNYFVSCRRAGTINRAILSFSHLLCKSTEKVLGTQTKSHSFSFLTSGVRNIARNQGHLVTKCLAFNRSRKTHLRMHQRIRQTLDYLN